MQSWGSKMFETVKAYMQERFSDMKNTDKTFMNDVLCRVENMSPDEAHWFSFSDLDIDLRSLSHEQIDEKIRVLTLLSTIPTSPLKLILYASGPDGQRKILTPTECTDALNSYSGTHPITQERVKNMRSIAHLGYGLRPEFVIEHLRHHCSDARVLITDDHEVAQTYSLMGVPTVTTRIEGKDHDYSVSKIYEAVNSGRCVVALKDTLSESFVLPKPYRITSLPGASNDLKQHVQDLSKRVTPWARTPEEETKVEP